MRFPRLGGIVRAKSTRLGYLEQHACSDGDRTLLDEVLLVFAPVMAMEAELRDITERLAGPDSGDDAHRAAASAAGTVRGRGRADLSQPCQGRPARPGLRRTCPVPAGLFPQRRAAPKAAMARLLLSDANLLLLDEPTNHLDIPSVEWLEEFLRAYPGAVVVISTTAISSTRSPAAPSNCREAGCIRRTAIIRLTATPGTRTGRSRKSISRPPAGKSGNWRTTSPCSSNGTGKIHPAAESREKRLERMKAALEVPESEADTIHFDFTAAMTSGNEVLVTDSLKMGFENRPLFDNVSFQVRRGNGYSSSVPTAAARPLCCAS